MEILTRPAGLGSPDLSGAWPGGNLLGPDFGDGHRGEQRLPGARSHSGHGCDNRGIDVKEFGLWWDVWWGRWGGSVESFLEMFRPSCSLRLLARLDVSFLVFDGAAGVAVLPRESSGDLVEPLYVFFFGLLHLCLCCQILYISSLVFSGTFFTSLFFSQYRPCSSCFFSVAFVWLILVF